MSLVSSSATCMASAMMNNSAENETFQKFFECWLTEQDSHLQDLISAANVAAPSSPSSPAPAPSASADAALGPLIERVVQHYERYYRAKARWARADVLAMLTPAWRSSLEDAFLWIGGWRPSMAFHLLYSKSGLQLEAAGRLADLVGGLGTGHDLADISAAQLGAVDELQRRTIREEKAISEEMAQCQETVAGSDMVELSHAVTEMLAGGAGDGGEAGTEVRVESALRPRERGLEEVLRRADELRLRTLKAILAILTPIQDVHFLIAAAELHLRIHEWGQRRDANNIGPHERAANSHR